MRYLAVLLVLLGLTGCAVHKSEDASVGHLAPEVQPATSQAREASVVPAVLKPTPIESPVLLGAEEVPERAAVYAVDLIDRSVWRVGLWDRVALAPDGSHLLIYGTGLDVVDWASRKAFRLFSGKVSAAAWSPDGKQIAFAPVASNAHESGQTDAVYVVDREGGPTRRAAGPAVADTLVWSPGGDPGWAVPPQRIAGPVPSGPVLRSPDERYLLVGEQIAGSGPRARRFSLVDTAQAQAGAAAAARPLLSAYDRPAWSPDGQNIAYVSNGCSTKAWDLWLAALDGSAPQRLTHSPAVIKEEPLWAPDGSRLVYGAHDRLVLVDVKTGAEETLVTTRQLYMLHAVAWTPDGQYIFFVPDAGRGVCD